MHSSVGEHQKHYITIDKTVVSGNTLWNIIFMVSKNGVYKAK
jgi:glutamine phosphoribosylpyrophosphate amidotransferase